MLQGQPIRIAIAEDHSALRQSLSALLSFSGEFAVAGTAVDGDEALELVLREHPDVLLLDLYMPGRSGFAVLRQLESSHLHTAGLVLTASEDPQDYALAVRHGARGLVRKGSDPEYLFTAIRLVAAGELAFTDAVARSILQAMTADPRSGQAQGMQRLSDRESEVARLVAAGMKNRDIAQQLRISENTVKRHLQSIFNKTGARDRLELAVLALNENSTAA